MKTILKMLEDPESDKDELNARIRAETHSYLTIYYKFKEFECGKEIALYRSHSGAEERLYVSNIPKYTTSLDAAMSIGAEELGGWIQTAVTGVKGIECYAHIGRLKSPNKNFEIYLMELPRAICHARCQALDHVRGL